MRSTSHPLPDLVEDRAESDWEEASDPRTSPADRRTSPADPRTSPADLLCTALQRRAPHMFRRHALRQLLRTLTLIGADLGTFLLLRSGARAARDFAIPGSGLHAFFTSGFPPGFLGGWHFAGALFIGLMVVGGYGTRTVGPDPLRLLYGCVLATFLVLWTPFWTLERPLVVLQFLVTVPVVWLAIYGARWVVWRKVGSLWMNGRTGTRAILVGSEWAVKRARRDPALFGPEGILVCGEVIVSESGDGSLVGLLDLVHRDHVDTIFVCGALTEAQLHQVWDAGLLAGCELLTLARSFSVPGVRPHLVWQGGHPLIQLNAPALKGSQLFLKRTLDVVLSSVGLLLLAPLLFLIAVLIKCDSRGPVLFPQERIGLGGRRFTMLKYRTMRIGADREKQELAHLNSSGDTRLFKIPNDPRTTAVGRVLRSWSLDELPQLWNVLRGDMSLVGPRPFFGEDLDTYEAHHFRRLGAKPGITGIWQVTGRSSITDFDEVVRMDREYIERWSVLLDLRILLLTLPAVVRRSGAC